MGKEADFLFTVTVGMPFGRLGEHKPVIFALFLYIVSQSNLKVTWTIRRSDWGSGSVRAVELECKRKWEQSGTIQMEVKLQQVSEEGSERCQDVLRKIL